MDEVLQHIRDSHEQDLKTFISPEELRDLRSHEPDLPLLDVRSREEFDAVKIEGSVFLNQESMQKFMGLPEDQLFVIVLSDREGCVSAEVGACRLQLLAEGAVRLVRERLRRQHPAGPAQP